MHIQTYLGIKLPNKKHLTKKSVSVLKYNNIKLYLLGKSVNTIFS